MRVRGLALVMAVFLATGCQATEPLSRKNDTLRAQRIRDELGVEPPTRLLYAERLDDGGSTVIGVVDARSESLHLFADNRLVRLDLDSAGRPLPPPPRHVYLHADPASPGAVRLEFGSRAESAVVDLLRLQVGGLINPREESTLVRVERAARRNRNSSWFSELSSRDRGVLILRGLVVQIERDQAEKGSRSPAGPGAPSGSPP